MSVDARDPREALFVFLFVFLFNLSLASCRLVAPPQATGMDSRRRAGPRLVQPSPESIQSRSRRIRPKPNLASTRSPIGRRPHPGSRIHLTGPKHRIRPLFPRNPFPALRSAPTSVSGASHQKQIPSQHGVLLSRHPQRSPAHAHDPRLPALIHPAPPW